MPLDDRRLRTLTTHATYLSNITRSASLERRTNPGVPSVRINWIFSLFRQTKLKIYVVSFWDITQCTSTLLKIMATAFLDTYYVEAML
jgi:hypothetical protein